MLLYLHENTINFTDEIMRDNNGFNDIYMMNRQVMIWEQIKDKTMNNI